MPALNPLRVERSGTYNCKCIRFVSGEVRAFSRNIRIAIGSVCIEPEIIYINAIDLTLQQTRTYIRAKFQYYAVV